MRFKTNFQNCQIKDEIEDIFYKKVGLYIDNCKYITIITGPNVKRHLDNIEKYIKCQYIRICDISNEVFVNIYNQIVDKPNITLHHGSIEKFGSVFIDCDLTCVSDIEVIKKTLLKQITVQCSNPKNKAFIFTIGLRKNNISKNVIFNSILGLLGSHVRYVKHSKKNNLTKGQFNYMKKQNISFINKGRIVDIESYAYNSGNGPMLTCLLIYK